MELIGQLLKYITTIQISMLSHELKSPHMVFYRFFVQKASWYTISYDNVQIKKFKSNNLSMSLILRYAIL